MPTWTGVAATDPFSIDHLPYGSIFVADGSRHVVVRIGARMLDLTEASRATDLANLFAEGTLDRLLGAGRSTWMHVRSTVTGWLTDPVHQSDMAPLLLDIEPATFGLAFTVADYADFYASEQHASNVGRMFRPDDAQPLTPNWKHLPIGYHGRAGTVVVSGTDIHRPSGQTRLPDGSMQVAPSARLDIEAELAFVVGTGTALGTPVLLADFREHVFGVCLLNDWSARDIQAWEYVPLGPFLGKSFATSISAWITPLDALEHAWTHPPHRDEPLLAYLDDAGRTDALDIRLEIALNGHCISRPPAAQLYWTSAQMLAHLTSNGASLRPGDLYASGTVSGAEPDELGSLLEISWNATREIAIGEQTRTFLRDGDEVVITASAPAPHGRIGLGEVRGRVVS